MDYQVPETLHADLAEPVITCADTLPWTPSPQPEIERRFLDRRGGEVARATSIVRYAAHSRFKEHRHELGEEFLVLSGVFSDHSGDFCAGTYVRNPPGSGHAPFTDEGCTIFVKLRQMPLSESRQVVRTPTEQSAQATDITGLSRITLFDCPAQETVHIEMMEPGTRWEQRSADGGEEILVLEGDLMYGDTACLPLCWLRMPADSVRSMSTRGGCRYWVKRGHLHA